MLIMCLLMTSVVVLVVVVVHVCLCQLIPFNNTGVRELKTLRHNRLNVRYHKKWPFTSFVKATAQHLLILTEQAQKK